MLALPISPCVFPSGTWATRNMLFMKLGHTSEGKKATTGEPLLVCLLSDGYQKTQAPDMGIRQANGVHFSSSS